MDRISELEIAVNERWGVNQFDWTIGKCPEGWFYYCGTHVDPHTDKTRFAHNGYAPTLTTVLEAMLAQEK